MNKIFRIGQSHTLADSGVMPIGEVGIRFIVPYLMMILCRIPRSHANTSVLIRGDTGIFHIAHVHIRKTGKGRENISNLLVDIGLILAFNGSRMVGHNDNVCLVTATKDLSATARNGQLNLVFVTTFIQGVEDAF